MSDLIDRQEAIRWVKTECNPYGKPTLDFESGKRIIEHLENMPSVQLEDEETNYWHEKANSYEQTLVKLAQSRAEQPEIIRCKDCKHYVLHVFFGRSQGWCERLCDEFDKSLARDAEDDDFCSRAERREE